MKNTYAGYSIGCAAVWAVILAVGRRRLDPQTRNSLEMGCGAWWCGWTSATIARAGYPPPEKLSPTAEKRLEIVSLVLVAIGLSSVIRLLAKGKPPAGTAADV
jgi:drug/metabolite transporter (DMT)-like permease